MYLSICVQLNRGPWCTGVLLDVNHVIAVHPKHTNSSSWSNSSLWLLYGSTLWPSLTPESRVEAQTPIFICNLTEPQLTPGPTYLQFFYTLLLDSCRSCFLQVYQREVILLPHEMNYNLVADCRWCTFIKKRLQIKSLHYTYPVSKSSLYEKTNIMNHLEPVSRTFT